MTPRCDTPGHERGDHGRCVTCREAAALARYVEQRPCLRGHRNRDPLGNCRTCAAARAAAWVKKG
jgi:hypothetical protein